MRLNGVAALGVSAARAGLFWISLVVAYNGHKQLLHTLTNERFSGDLSDAVYAAMLPAVLCAFTAQLAVGNVWRARGKAPAFVGWLTSALMIGAYVWHAAPQVGITYAAALLLFGVALLAVAPAVRAVGRTPALGRRARARFRALSAQSDRRLLALGGIALALVIGAAWLSAEAFVASRNTLHRNGHWQSAKIGPEPGVPLARNVMGAIAYVTTRTALGRNHLNLGAWHGFQELWYGEPLTAEAISFRFRLPDGAYVALLFEGNATGFSGLRLSRNERFPGLCFAADSDRIFVRTEPIDADVGSGWHRVRLARAGQRYAVWLDGVRIATCGTVGARPQRIGFRGSLKNAYVDDVRVEGPAGEVVVTETFRNTDELPWAFALTFLVALLLVGAALAASRRSLEPGPEPRLFVAVATSFGLFVSCGAYYLFDTFQLSRLHPSDVEYFDYPSRSGSEAEVRAELQHRYAGTSDAYRVLMLGGSQTWGSGASEDQDVICAQLERLLEATGSPIECIAGAVPAFGSDRFVPMYESEWAPFGARIVVVNASNNDETPQSFDAHLRRLVAYNRPRGIATVFALEANSKEGPERRLAGNHAVMRALAAELGVPLVDVHERLERRRDEGLLWWDHVHLTSAGQRLVAEELARELLPMIERDRAHDAARR